ncbi:MAG: hypothetical protein NVS9B10_27360 [Nevskia sp.]
MPASAIFPTWPVCHDNIHEPATVADHLMPTRFSVIVTSYNYRDFVFDAIDSVLAQRSPAAQIIVVDDGSTDGSADLLRSRYGNEPRVQLRLKENGGQLSAFVAGLAAADGDVVCFLDADDLWEPDHLERLDLAYAHDSAPDFVFTNLRFFGGRDGLWHDSTQDRDLGISVLPTYAFRHWEGSPTSAISIRRGLARALVDLPPALRALQPWRSRADDPLVYGSALLHARKRYLGAASVRYRAHGANIWLGREESASARIRYAYTCDALLSYYAQLGGISRRSLMRVKDEFRTKPRPTAQELLMYRRAAWLAPASMAKRLELVIGIYRHYWRTRSPRA